jgi:hypothetical protein
MPTKAPPATGKTTSASAQPQDGLTRGVQLSTGFDRLKFGLYVQFDTERFFDILTDAKTEAQELRSQIPLRLGPDQNYDYNVHPNGRKGGYNFHIARADVDIFISTRKDYLLTPNVWVDIGSASCWSPGYTEVIHYITKLLKLWDGKIIKNSVSEVHLCADCIGLDIEQLPLQYWNHWVTRANRLHAFSDRNRFSGITITQTEGTLNLDTDHHCHNTRSTARTVTRTGPGSTTSGTSSSPSPGASITRSAAENCSPRRTNTNWPT